MFLTSIFSQSTYCLVYARTMREVGSTALYVADVLAKAQAGDLAVGEDYVLV
jgi:hypothetical protein